MMLLGRMQTQGMVGYQTTGLGAIDNL